MYGSAIGLVEPNDIDRSKNCFRVLDGVEYVVLQAESQTSQLEWAVAIAHSISMENGGGILLDKEKMRDGGFPLNSAGFPLDGNVATTSSVIHRANTEDVDFATSIIFAKPVKEGSTCRLNPISETAHSSRPESTQEVFNANFDISIENAELPLSMEQFASNYFDAHKQVQSSKGTFPVQALRSDDMQPWHIIDRASSESSASEIFDKVSDFEESTQLNAGDYSKLVQLTEAGVSMK